MSTEPRKTKKERPDAYRSLVPKELWPLADRTAWEEACRPACARHAEARQAT